MFHAFYDDGYRASAIALSLDLLILHIIGFKLYESDNIHKTFYLKHIATCSAFERIPTLFGRVDTVCRISEVDPRRQCGDAPKLSDQARVILAQRFARECYQA